MDHLAIILALLFGPIVVAILVMACDYLWFQVRPRMIRRREEKVFSRSISSQP